MFIHLNPAMWHFNFAKSVQRLPSVLPVLEKGGNGAYLLTCLVTVHTEAAKVTGKDIQYMTPTHIPPPPASLAMTKMTVTSSAYYVNENEKQCINQGRGGQQGGIILKPGLGHMCGIVQCTCTPNSFLFKIFQLLIFPALKASLQ